MALAVGLVVLAVDRDQTARALAPIYLLQALATSSGFAAPARRGHYDLLLTAGHGRLRIGVAHWAASAAPGVACWLLVAAVEAALNRGVAAVALAPGTMIGMVFVSTVPWAMTVPLPRLTGGLAWVLLLVIAVPSVPTTDRAVLASNTLAVLICPWILAGHRLAGGTLIPGAVALAISVGALVCALTWIDRADVPLEAAQ